jgi:hypothetical protein
MRIVNPDRTKLFLVASSLIIGLSFVLNSSGSVTSRELKASPVEPSQEDLTGTWTSETRGTYYVRQVGTTVWWVGRSQDGGASYTNVFNGVRSGDQITGMWADVPAGRNTGSGSLTLAITRTGGNVEIRKVKETGGFGESIWKKPGQQQPGVCTITGRVQGDRSVYGTRINLFRSGSSNPLQTVSVMNGQYTIANVAEGSYQVRGKLSNPMTQQTPRGPIGFMLVSDGDQNVTCERGQPIRVNFKVVSSEG